MVRTSAALLADLLGAAQAGSGYSTLPARSRSSRAFPRATCCCSTGRARTRTTTRTRPTRRTTSFASCCPSWGRSRAG